MIDINFNKYIKGKIVYSNICISPFLPETSDSAFIMLENLTKEIKKFCEKQGYNIYKILFFSMMDGDILNVKEDKNKDILFHSDSYLFILEEKMGDFVACVYFKSIIKKKENK